MELPVAIIILVIALIVLALAVFLLATIMELFKINAGLDGVLVGVSEIGTKTAPVNGVLDAINGTLVTGRDLLEGLALKKAGTDAAGLVESAFPGEGQRFLQRIGRSGTVVTIGEDYARGTAILNSLLGAGAPPAAPAAESAPAAAVPAGNGGGGRISLRTSSPPAPAASPPPPAPVPAASPSAGRGGGGRISLRSSSPPPVTPPSAPGRLSARSSRPWE